MQLSTALPEGLQYYGIMYSTTRVIGTAQRQIHGHSDVWKTTERDPGSKHEAIPSEPQLGRPLATSFRHLLARNQLASNLQRGILPRASFSDTRFHLAPSTDLFPTASFSSSLTPCTGTASASCGGDSIAVRVAGPFHGVAAILFVPLEQLVVVFMYLTRVEVPVSPQN